jgi:hypothetical protein
MIPAFLVLSLSLFTPLLDSGLRAPDSAEVRSAERRNQARLPIIVRVCREAVKSRDMVAHIKRFADANGLSSYGRSTLTLHCRIYKQGAQDGLTQR